VTLKPVVPWIERGLVVFALMMGGLLLRGCSQAQAYQSLSSQRLDAALRGSASKCESAKERSDRRAALATGAGSALGRIEIPRLRISAMIAEGTGAEVLDRAVGHVASTPRPGSPGNVALAAHRDSYFRGLGNIRENDVIRIVTPEATYRYRVQWTEIVAPERVDVLEATDRASLTLVTCYPFEWVGHAPQRFVVRAIRDDPALSTPPAGIEATNINVGSRAKERRLPLSSPDGRSTP
jgi:sortase A